MKNHINFHYQAQVDDTDTRIDQLLCRHLKPYSRSQIQHWIKSGSLLINGSAVTTPKYKPRNGDTLVLDLTLEDHSHAQPEALHLDKIFEDEHLLLINKPANLIVHPGAGNPSGTLLNALLFDCPQLSKLPRAGIVHRLDKNTTGIMMVAKTFAAYHALTHMLAERTIQREYIAVIDGNLKCGLSIDKPIGRHPTSRQKMAISTQGKPAVSHVQLLDRFSAYTLVNVKLETGRTHQIRVHMQSIGHPLLGDPTYGKHRGYQKLSPDLAQQILSFPRQALHAHTLKFQHPILLTHCQHSAPIPNDLQQLINTLKKNSANV